MAYNAPMLPDLESLRCFLEAARQSSFRAAAQRVALSPAAFGERIRNLEQVLGTPLFERTTRSVRLTLAGEKLVPQATRCLDEAQRCAEVLDDGQSRPFELVVGTRYELGMSFIVPSLKKLEAKRPERHLHVYLGDTSDMLPRLKRGELDAIITSARLAAPDLELLRLHEEQYAFVAAPKLLGHTPLDQPADAARHTLLDVHGDLPLFRYFRDARPATEVWSFARIQRLGGIGPIRLRVLEGAGVAVLPAYFVVKDLRAKRLHRLFPRTPLPSDWFRLVWSRGHPRTDELSELARDIAAMPLR